jgi:hypothetical protein
MFFYIPVSPERMAASAPLQGLHRILACLYYPIWKFDNQIFHGPMVGGIPLKGLRASEYKEPVLARPTATPRSPGQF